ncbi:MAG: hypothetical protein WCR51_01435 [Planctomycetia bacterium]
MMPWSSKFCVGIVLVLSLGLGFYATAADQVPPPAGAELDAAMESVKAIYADKASKAKTPSERAALAREVFGHRDAASTQAERYAIVMAALNIATKSDDALLLMTICDDLAATFTVDRIRLFVDRVDDTTGPVSQAAWPKLKDRLDGMADACLQANRFDDATKLATAMMSLAKRARDAKAGTATTALRKTIADRKKARERYEDLANAANQRDADPKTLLEFGRMLCFTEGDWAQGVRYLARSDDAALSAVAAAEARAATPEAQLAVADAWATYAEKAPVNEREPIRDHAAEIYTEVIPTLTGLAKVRAEKALDDVLAASQSTKDGNAWLVVFRSDNPKIWNTESRDDPRNFAVPLDSLPQTIRFVRIRRSNGQTVIAPISKQTIGSLSRGPRYGWEGSKPERFGALLLGIIDNEANVHQKTGEVGIVDSGQDCRSGWGFGIRINHGNQAVCWAGKWIPTEPLEIAVAKRPLSPDEQKLLLE